MSVGNLKIILSGEALSQDKLMCYLKAFKNASHNVMVQNIRDFYKLNITNRIINKFRKIPVFFGINLLNLTLIQMAKDIKPDLILFFKPRFILYRTLLELRKNNVVVFSWYGDDILNYSHVSTDFYESVSLYDCHFLTKSFNINEVLKMGARKAVFLPHAADLAIHFPIEVSEEEKRRFGADIVFIGTYEKHRADILENLCQLGYQIKIYGNDWERVWRNSYLRKKGCIMFKPVYGEEMSRVINSSKIVLAFLRKANRDLQTARTYEIPACGGFMLHERTDEAKLLFEEGKEAEFFNSFGELRKKIDYYLKNDDLRINIARLGYKKVIKADYTYRPRAEKILEVYSERKCVDL